MFLRELPLSLHETVPMTLLPGEELELETRAPEAGTLRAMAEDGRALPLKVGERSWSPDPDVKKGRYTVRIRNDAKRVTHASLRLEPHALKPLTPLPVLSAERLASLPEFPVLDAAATAYLDLDRQSSTTWLVEVGAPSLYRLETTGLLATEGVLRTRTRTGFASGAENGVGRNFAVARYLREGDYQVTLSTRGRSKGHLGLRLAHTPLVEGGALVDGVPARISLPEHRAVAYTFTLEEAGTYRVQSFGRGRTFQCRLEDDDGWPLMEPVVSCDQRRRLEPGSYRVVVLPEGVPTQRITRLTRERAAETFSGHGPHRAALGGSVSHTWYEPTEGGERTPDRWAFSLPAPATVTASLSDEMTGEILHADEQVGRLVPGRRWSGELPAGDYLVAVRGARKNNGIHYTLGLHPTELVPGLRRSVSVPAELAVSVGQRGLVELSSFGTVDVRARLYDPGGKLMASNDDRPDDWNFLITERLDPGRYALRVDPVGASSGEIQVAMAAPDELEGEGLSAGGSQVLDPGDAVLHVPLVLPRAVQLVVTTARSDESVGIAVEAWVDGVWRTLGEQTGAEATLAVRALSEVVPYRLRVWSLDQRGSAVTVALHAPAPHPVSAKQLERGVSLRMARGAPLGSVAVEPVKPGLFQLSGAWSTLRVCAAPGEACRVPERAMVAATEHGLWLVGPRGSAQARRVEASAGDEPVVPVPSDGTVAVDLGSGSGPLAVFAHSPSGQPGLRLARKASAGRDPAGMGVSHSGALAVDLEGNASAAILWSGSGQALDVRLRPVRFSDTPWERGDWGVIDGTLGPGEARPIKLRGPRRDVRLGLEHGLVAVTTGEDGATVHWAGDASLEEFVPLAGDRLTLLNPGDAPALYTVEVLPALRADPPTLSRAAPFEHIETRAGTRRVPVVPLPDATLKVRGAVREAVYLRADGAVLRGRELPVGGGGELVLHHGPGAVLAWVDGPADDGPWAKVAAPRAVQVGAAEQVVLSGIAQHLGVALDGPAMLHLSTPCPLVARIEPVDGPTRIEVHEAGGRLDTWLPTGEAEIILRALRGTTLWGTAAITTTPATDIGEGLGPEVLLAPGSTRLFRFEVERKGQVGVGIRADADRVTATVLDQAGAQIGTGMAQMVELTPGTWFLALHLPEDSDPVRARPALAGVEPPETGPPAEVVRKYLDLATPSAGGTP
jgi:hypothetical protein